ncbi:hypothetical protein RHGRI_025105 [Rhododendron griersonianum]|uniref:Uncharacterized protein n=1 Tax=Rhododendron griersonianum TaxID=479676 RepID=A0AAV6JE86_9ERIC|nr:hypothetical protein RHGRI_025105 [Rhododendron griersonianum]
MQSLRSELYSVVTVEGFTTHHIGALTGRIVLYMELRGFRLRFQSPFCELKDASVLLHTEHFMLLFLTTSFGGTERIRWSGDMSLNLPVLQIFCSPWLQSFRFLVDDLKLSRPFFDLHMPGHDASCVLVDASDQEEYRIKYLVAKSLFSGGWGAFSIAHRLLEGDLFCGLEELYFAVFSIGMGYIGIGKGESMGLKHASAVCSNASP